MSGHPVADDSENGPAMSPPNPAPAALLHSAFYRFTPLADPTAAAHTLRVLAQGLLGLITVACEGINGALCGPAASMQAFEAALQDPACLGGALAGMPFKHSHGITPAFARLKVLVKPEIVALGLPAADHLPPPTEHDDSHVAPAQWRELLDRDDVVLLDNRNRFEWRLGHFRGAPDPQVQNFRELVDWVQVQAPVWREQGRTVAMYCTGGIRCDKTAPWLRSLGLKVLQLEGGILNHFATLADAERDWQGECFVFDKRIALDTSLHETATRAEQVFDPAERDEAWRLQRAQRLAGY